MNKIHKHKPVFAKVSFTMENQNEHCYIIRQGKEMFRIPKNKVRDVVHGLNRSIAEIEDTICSELQIQTIQ